MHAVANTPVEPAGLTHWKSPSLHGTPVVRLRGTRINCAEGFRYFCGECGGRLFNRPMSTLKFLLLVVATLDEEPE